MSQILTLKLSDQVFTAIQRQAEAMGVPPERLATRLLEQRFGSGLNTWLTAVEQETARARFERHFGTLNRASEMDVDNESIDADLVREYASTHEED